MQWLNRQTGVEHLPFIDREHDLYSAASVLVVWSAKKFGLINRTLRAMAAGTVVVGNDGAFNGIEGFVHGKHGLLVSSLDGIADTLSDILGGRVDGAQIASAARQLVRDQYTWENCFGQALRLIGDGLPMSATDEKK